jgi:ribosomal protein L37AE/L43A
MNIKKFLFDRFISAIITPPLILAFLAYVYSLIKNINWIDALYSIPPIIWIILVLVIVVWVCIVAIRKKMDYTNSGYVAGIPRNGWENVLRKDYFGVKWQVRTPRHDPVFQNPFETNKVPKLNVDSTPRCPKCETKLEISEHLLWHTWECPNCGFKKQTWESNFKIRDRVQNVVDRELEVEVERENSRIRR